MKITSIVLLLTFTLNVMAAPLKSLESSFDNYNYAITVEWDQKDQKFYQTKTNEFMNEVSDLILYEGVTKDEILSLVEKKIGSKEVVESIRLRLSIMGEVNSSNVVQVLQDISKDFYARGASWDGETWGTMGLISGGVLLIGFFIWFSIKYDCVEYEYRRRSGCDSSNCYKKVCVKYVER